IQLQSQTRSRQLNSLESKVKMPAEGLQRSQVDSIRDEVEKAIEDTLANLRRIEISAQQRLREATIEQQQLDIFLDEMHYRLQFLTQDSDGGPPRTITGPLSQEQLNGMHKQEGSLLERKADLQKD